MSRYVYVAHSIDSEGRYLPVPDMVFSKHLDNLTIALGSVVHITERIKVKCPSKK